MNDQEFYDHLRKEFQGQKVRVSTSKNTYEGWLRSWRLFEGGHGVLLFDATDAAGGRHDSVMVDQFHSIELVGDVTPIETVPLESITESPYSVRTFETEHDYTGSREVYEWGHLHSFPTVRTVNGEQYELVSGHRRTWGARNAGLTSIPVRIVEMTDWEATVTFVHEHVPQPSERTDSTPAEFYTEEQIQEAFEILVDRWPVDKLRELHALEPEIEAYTTDG